MSTIKIRTKVQGSKTLVRLLIEHPMTTGRSQDELTGAIIPAHFITELEVEHNGKRVVQALPSTAVSRNPYFSFRLNHARSGDLIKVVWKDNLGQTDTATARISQPTAEGAENPA